MNGRTILALVGVVGLAATANAQSMFDGKIKFVRGRTVQPTTINGQAYTPASAPDVIEDLYVNNTARFGSLTAPNNRALGADQVSIQPQKSGAFTLNEINISWVLPQPSGSPPVSFDALVSFWDDGNFTAPAGQPVHVTQVGPTIRLGFTNVATGFYYSVTTNVVLPTPINFDDDTFMVRYEYVQPGTTTIMDPNIVTLGIALSEATGGPLPGSSPNPGAQSVAWADFDSNGMVEATEAFNLNQGTLAANWGFIARGEAAGGGGCYADCDTSTGVGVLDIFDFLCFQNSFSNSEPYACECDTSTGVNVCDIFDFLCFQNAFSNGCP